MVVNLLIIVFWVVSPYGLVGGYERLFHCHSKHAEDIIIQNADNHLQGQTAL